MSHARTVQSVSEAGQGLLLSSLGESVEGLQRSLRQLGQRWDLVQSETESRQLELENNLSQVRGCPSRCCPLWYCPLAGVVLRLPPSPPSRCRT